MFGEINASYLLIECIFVQYYLTMSVELRLNGASSVLMQF